MDLASRWGRAALFATTAICVLGGLGSSALAEASPEATVSEVVVTGSQVVRRGYESPTPLTVMTAQDLQASAPTNIADYIGKFPEFTNSSSARNSATSVSDGNGGVSNLNLRGLGPNRTLVLLDGMRVAPSSISGSYNRGGAVDTNAFPDALISRVDVVTGGASAAYGSDALAGVVNFILDKKFTGLKGTFEGGGTTHGDDGQYLMSLTGGAGFADDRGHILLSGSLNHVDGVAHGSSRAWLRQGYDQITNPAYTPTNGQPFYVITKQVGSGLYTPGGLISSGPLRGVDFGPGGSTRMFNYGAVSPGGATMAGGDWQETVGALNDSSEGFTASLDDRVTRENLFTRASFDVTDNFEVFAQVMYSNTSNFSYAYNSTESVTIKSGNPFIPEAVQAQMTALGLASFPLSVWNSDQQPVAVSNRRQLSQYVLGGDGRFDAFGKSWSWNVSANRSVTLSNLRALNEPITAVFQNAVNVVRSPVTGQPVCASTLINPNDGCIPYNPMGTGVNSQAAIDYATGGVSQLHQNIYQNDFSATLRGEPASTWAGPISLATGVEHRTQKVRGVSSALDEANAFFSGNFHATNGSYAVTEGFAETVIPLAKDVAWARGFDVNAAVRETDYSTSGRVTTWKLGATYDTPISGLRFRATRSRDIRAPNLGELYSGGSSSFGSILDPAKGNQTQTNVLTVKIGNPDLQPEVAKTTGLGVIYQPTWLPGFSASIDYFKVNVSNAVGSLSAQDEVTGCFNGNQVYCDFIQRSSDGKIQTIYVKPANTAYLRTSGFDIESSYRKNLYEISDKLNGSLSIHALATNVADLSSVAPNGVVTQGAGFNSGQGSMGVPTWSYSLNVTYASDAIDVNWTGRGFSAGKLSPFYIECTSACPAVSAPYYTINNNHMPGEFYMDASVVYHIKSKLVDSADAFVSIENITNNVPDDYFVAISNSIYDKLGRVVRTGIRFRM